jgi:FtsP/CotA-like multicopper oxidase with cupredoxin domain
MNTILAYSYQVDMSLTSKIFSIQQVTSITSNKKQGSLASAVDLRIPFEDFVGKSVYHCHLMFHGDFGMMGTFEVVK